MRHHPNAFPNQRPETVDRHISKPESTVSTNTSYDMNATLINTYKDLRRWCKAFVRGDWPCLILLGTPGLGKSSALESVLPPFESPPTTDEERAAATSPPQGAGPKEQGTPHARWLTSHVSAFEMYQNLWAYKDQIIVFDDVDDLYGDKLAVKMLKAACDTRKVKKIAWHTANKEFFRLNIPKEFESRSRTVIIANEWQSFNKNVGALEDRAMMLKFAPSAVEVHKEAGRWFEDDEILSFFKANLDRIHCPSFRHYVNAKSMKKGKLDWRSWLEDRFSPPDEHRIVGSLMDDKRFTFEGDRISQFMQVTGRSRAHYFNLKKEIVERRRANAISAPKPKGKAA